MKAGVIRKSMIIEGKLTLGNRTLYRMLKFRKKNLMKLKSTTFNCLMSTNKVNKE